MIAVGSITALPLDGINAWIRDNGKIAAGRRVGQEHTAYLLGSARYNCA